MVIEAYANTDRNYQDALLAHQAKVQRICAQLQQSDSADAQIRLQKDTTNLFRNRSQVVNKKIDVRSLNQVLYVDVAKQLVVVEGMTTYEDLTAAVLKYGFMPAVVPELKTITIGGALSGIGIESSSFRYGLVHETISEFDVLLANGKVITATAENQHKDLFFAFPNSYGTFGYALRIVAKIVPVKAFVKLQHIRFHDPKKFIEEIKTYCLEKNNQIDFIDNSVFSPDEMYITIGQFVDVAPYTSDYKFMKIYYRSISRRSEDYLTTADYIWRWDADWFWCSKVFGIQHPVLRFLFGKWCLRSKFYSQVKKFFYKNKIAKWLADHLMVRSESVIQDVCIPVENAERFFHFFNEKIGIKPFWICPFKAYRAEYHYNFFPQTSGQLYLNFGFWDMIKSKFPMGYYNRQIEAEVKALSGMKSLYSDAYYTQDEFWQLYNQNDYQSLKQKYDENQQLSDIYHKCIEK